MKALADGTMERWFTDEFKKVKSDDGARSATRSAAPRRTGFLGCAFGDPDFSTMKASCDDQDDDPVDLRRRGSRHTARPQIVNRLQGHGGRSRGNRQGAPCPMSTDGFSSIASCVWLAAKDDHCLPLQSGGGPQRGRRGKAHRQGSKFLDLESAGLVLRLSHPARATSPVMPGGAMLRSIHGFRLLRGTSLPLKERGAKLCAQAPKFDGKYG